MIDLTKWCDPNGIREFLRTPHRRGGFTYATNGHIAIRLADDPTVDCGRDEDSITFPFLSVDGFVSGELVGEGVQLIDLPALESCEACEGTGAMLAEVLCPSCDGRGERLSGQRRRKCSKCAGAGWELSATETDPCDECDGRTFKRTGHDIGVARFDLRYLHIAAELPNARIHPTAEDTAAIVIFDGGRAVIMPILKAVIMPIRK